MVLAYHAIFTAYGFWLPNDPRGSWSDEVWAKDLKPFGPSTKTNERRSLARRPHDRSKRLEAKQSLQYPPVVFNGLQARAVARGFSLILPTLDLPLYACAIMPDHAHVVLPRHHETVEQIVGFLKRAATRQLSAEGIHPLSDHCSARGRVPTPWVLGGWNRFLNDQRAIIDAIDYVEKNPTKAGLRRQHWSFVLPFKGVRDGIASPRRLNEDADEGADWSAK